MIKHFERRYVKKLTKRQLKHMREVYNETFVDDVVRNEGLQITLHDFKRNGDSYSYRLVTGVDERWNTKATNRWDIPDDEWVVNNVFVKEIDHLPKELFEL